MNTNRRTVAPVHLAAGVLAAGILSGALLAQQFAESAKSYLPLHRDASRGLAAADVDQDGDVDVLFCNNGVVTYQQSRLCLNDGKGVFTDATATHLPADPQRANCAAFGDVDGDGDADVVIGNSEGQDRLYLNDGTGRFVDQTAGRMPAGQFETSSLVLEDLDGDQDLDCALTGQSGTKRQSRVYLNDGAGTFTDVTATNVPVDADNTWDMCAGDVDGDGDVDLLYGNNGQCRLYLNDGSAVFSDATGTSLPVQATAAGGIALGDVDGDGDPDIALAIFKGRNRLYLNDGTGVFTDATATRMPPAPVQSAIDWTWDLAIADVDGDGDVDLAFAGQGQDLLYVNDGTGVFTDVTAARLPQQVDVTDDVVLVDVDGDQDVDLLSANIWQQNGLYLNDGKGSFADATPSPLPPDLDETRALASGDVDGDGDLDLVVGNSGDYYWQNKLYRNDGRGGFTDVTGSTVPVDTDDTRAVVLGDIDGDGDLDLLCGNALTQDRLYLNDGTGVFTDVTAARMPADAEATSCASIDDVNGDGMKDLVLGSHAGPSVRVYLNDGAGAFLVAPLGNVPAGGFETRAIALCDVDGDGDLDLALANGALGGVQNRLFVNDGSGVFTDVTAARFPVDVLPSSSVSVGDIDGDQDLDLYFGNDAYPVGRTNSLYVNDGTGSFSFKWAVYDSFQTLSTAIGDVDGDGDLDLVCGDHDHPNKLYLNDGAGRFSDASLWRMPFVVEETNAVLLFDVDGDGDLDLVSGDSGAGTPVRFENALYLNHQRQIGSQRLPRVGELYPLEVSAQRGYATGAQSAIVLLGLQGLTPGLPLPPFGTLGVDPSGMVQVPLPIPAPAGTATLPIPIPAVQALVGLELYEQALIFHTPNPLDARFTNVMKVTIV